MAEMMRKASAMAAPGSNSASQEIKERLMVLSRREDGITALVSLHTLGLTREYADRVIGLKDGKIFFDGPTQELSNVVVDSVYEQNE
jgi:ABC-type phosphate/phosphonate transport system ATPase subunit